jgi:aminoglycoside phosphotransferase family enzyme
MAIREPAVTETARKLSIAEALARILARHGQEVERFETHLSHVFLAGDRAYKIKKSVRLPFVDFSTVEQRHAACLAELETNRLLGSPLYLDVVPVVEDEAGEVALCGKGRTVDWAVVMRRFDPSLQFDELARSGRLDRDVAIRSSNCTTRSIPGKPWRKMS